VGPGELPHNRALRYINKISDGDMPDIHGRPINALKPARFYCYLVCDLTQQLKAELRDDGFHASLTIYLFSKRFPIWEQNRFVYYEYISFDKLYEDAEKRNQSLFHKLGIIPDPSAQE